MHENLFSNSEIGSLTGIIDARGGRVENILSGGYDERTLSDQLKYASAYISVCPTVAYTSGEVQLLQAFVGRGGRLLILTDPTRSVLRADYSGFGSAVVVADVIAANTLLAPFDITFTDDYLYNMTEYEGNFRNVYIRNFGDHPITDGLQTLVLYAAHSVQTKTGTQLLLTSGATKSSRPTKAGSSRPRRWTRAGKCSRSGICPSFSRRTTRWPTTHCGSSTSRISCSAPSASTICRIFPSSSRGRWRLCR